MIAKCEYDPDIPERRASLKKSLAAWDRKHQDLLAPCIAAAAKEAEAQAGFAAQETLAEAEDADEDNQEAQAMALEEAEAVTREEAFAKTLGENDDEEDSDDSDEGRSRRKSAGKGNGRAKRAASNPTSSAWKKRAHAAETAKKRQAVVATTNASASQTKGAKRKRGAAGEDLSKVEATTRDDVGAEEDVALEDALAGGPTQKKRKIQTAVQAPARRSALWSEVNNSFTILLPSVCLPEVRAQPALRQAVEMEIALRRGEAGEALDDLRTHLITANLFRKYVKKTKQRSNHAMRTRYKSSHINKSENINGAARRYRRAYHALAALGVENDEDFPRLRNEDVKAFGVDQDERALGESKASTEESWIWRRLEFATGSELQEKFDTYAEAGKWHSIHASHFLNGVCSYQGSLVPSERKQLEVDRASRRRRRGDGPNGAVPQVAASRLASQSQERRNARRKCERIVCEKVSIRPNLHEQ